MATDDNLKAHAKALIAFLAESTDQGLRLYSEFDRYGRTSKILLKLINNLNRELNNEPTTTAKAGNHNRHS